MTEQYLARLIAALRQNPRLLGYDVAYAFPGQACEYPLDSPVVRVGRKKTEASPLLGSGEVLLEENVLEIAVLTDEKQGAAFCDQCAAEVCRAVFDEDRQRRVTSVCVEGAMYEKNSFAYKVIMDIKL